MQDKYSVLIDLSDSICWGHTVINTRDGNVVFRALSIQEKMIAKHVYETAIKSAEKIGLKSKAALLIEAKMLGLWNEEHDKQLLDLEEEKRSIELEISKTKQKSKIEKLNRRLVFINNMMSPFVELRHRLLEAPNIENYAASEKIKYIIAVSALTFPNMELIWGSMDKFELENRMEFVTDVIRGYCSHANQMIPESSIREIARSGHWRIKWCAAKTGGGIPSLFCNSGSDYTNNQIKLIYWSQLYDSVYDSPDRPSDEIINDDVKLDEWIEEKTKEAEQKRKNNTLTNKLKTKNSKATNANELIYSVDGFYSDKCTCNKPNGYHEKNCLYGVYLYHTKSQRDKKISEIQDNNPNEVRLLLARERAMLEKHGTIEEQHLRKDPKTRALLGMNTKTVNSRGQ